ncbi:ulp1 protease family, C-terminal catalytic domain-containing protein [Tanacetum coccineum]
MPQTTTISMTTNVKQLFEQYKGFFKETVLLEEAKAQKAPQNVKPKPAAVNTKEAAEKPKPAENVKELAEKAKELAEKSQKAPQNVKPKPAAVKTKEWLKSQRSWLVMIIRRIVVTARCKKGFVFVLGNAGFAHGWDKFETVFQSLGGYHDLSSVRVNMETVSSSGLSTPTRHFFPTGCINQGIIKGTLTEEEQWKSFLDEIKAQFKYEPSSMSLSDFELVFFPIYAFNHFYVVVFNIKNPKTMVILDNSDSGYTYASKYKEACDPLKKLFSRYLKEQNHSSHEAVAKMRPFIPKLKWRTSNNHVDCGVFAMIHMENYVGDAAKIWEFGLCEESDEQLSMNNRDPPKQVKETDAANVVVGVNEAVDQVKEKGCRKK